MPPALFYPALVVLVGLAVLYAVALRAVWGYRRTRRLTRLGGGAIAAALVSLACFAEGTWVEPYWPEVTHTEIQTPRLPAGAVVRIVQLSDVHAEVQPRLEERLPGLVAAERPDLIVFTGDAANLREGWPTFRRLMGELARVAPTYAVKGNWDMQAPSASLFGGSGAVELRGKPVAIAVRGARFTLGGTPFSFGSGARRAMQALPDDGLRVFLYHTPDEIQAARDHVDVYLAGHTHGGQVRLPGFGAVVTMSQFGKRFEAGRYQLGPTTLYVNRGIGMEGHFPFKVRFLCRPEVAVIDLKGSGGPPARSP